MCDGPFMAYFICHESWLRNVNKYNDGGVNVKGIVNTKSHFGFRTIGMRRYFDVGGGQGGGVNAPWDGVKSIPKLGLSWFHDSFGSMVVMLYSTLLLLSLHEVWFASMPWEGILFTWVCNIVYMLFQLEDWYTSNALRFFVCR